METSLDALRFPFLGAREDGEPFEYLLIEVNQEAAFIAIYKWMVNAIHLNLEEKVNLFIPNSLTTIYPLRHNTPGVVHSIREEKEDQAYFYEVVFHYEKSFNHLKGPKELAQILPSESSLINMLIQLIKDSLILKQGILVYLKHLAPYFSRIVDYSQQDYQLFQEVIFNDLKRRIMANADALYALYQLLKNIKNFSDILILINLEYLRENMESEINADLFLLAFSNLDSRENLMNLLKKSSYQTNFKSIYHYMNYLIAIKELENRLYSNYNQIVLIYLKFIT